MADEFTKWQRNQPSPQVDHKRPMEVKWRASHTSFTKRGDNPYKKEAERDRVIFRWIMAVVFIVVVVAYIVYLMISQSSK